MHEAVAEGSELQQVNNNRPERDMIVSLPRWRRSSLIRYLTATASVASVVVACGGGGESNPAAVVTPVLTTVSVSFASASLYPGQTTTATAAGLDQKSAPISIGTVTWFTNNAAVATINGSGAVTAIAAGTAQITATSGATSGQATLTVNPVPVASVVVTPATVSVTVGTTRQLSASTLDASANPLTGRVITWATSDASKATVSASGLVTGVAAGTATITATSEGKSGAAVVSVVALPASQVAIRTQPGGAATIGSPIAPAAVVEIRDANNALVSSSSATVVATLTGGSGTLSGATSVSAVNGVATFSNLIVSLAGSYTITFTSVGLTSATTSAILVTTPQPLFVLGNSASQSATVNTDTDVPLILYMSAAGGKNIAAFKVVISWDPTRVSLTSTTSGSVGIMTPNTTIAGQVTVVWFNVSGVTATTTMGTLKLKPLVAGSTSISISVQSAGDETGSNVAVGSRGLTLIAN